MYALLVGHSAQPLFDVPGDNETFTNTNEGGLWVLAVAYEPDSDITWEPAMTIATHEVFVGVDKLLPEVTIVVDKYGNRGFNTNLTFRAAVHLGFTAWSGYDSGGNEYWLCRESDLTTEGRLLHAMLGQVFPQAKIYLLTFLDT